jgi:hypothetical protein
VTRSGTPQERMNHRYPLVGPLSSNDKCPTTDIYRKRTKPAKQLFDAVNRWFVPVASGIFQYFRSCSLAPNFRWVAAGGESGCADPVICPLGCRRTAGGKRPLFGTMVVLVGVPVKLEIVC